MQKIYLIYVGWMRVIEPMIYPSSYRVYCPRKSINDLPEPVSSQDYGSGVGSDKADNVTSLQGGNGTRAVLPVQPDRKTWSWNVEWPI